MNRYADAEHLFRFAPALLLAAGMVAWSGLAQADPPYGDEFDAPESIDAAVAIRPSAPGTLYRALYGFWGDVDAYAIGVGTGARALRIRCLWMPFHQTGGGEAGFQTVAQQSAPCTAHLVDPSGRVVAGAPSADGRMLVFQVTDAAPGAWRLVVSGDDMQMFLMDDERTSRYYFDVALDGGSAAYGDAGGGGALGALAALCLGLAALMRRARLALLPLVLAMAAPGVARADPAASADAYWLAPGVAEPDRAPRARVRTGWQAAAEAKPDDVICTYESSLGSHLKRRICASRATRDARTQAEQRALAEPRGRTAGGKPTTPTPQ